MDSNCYDQSRLRVLGIHAMNKRMEQNIYRYIKKMECLWQKTMQSRMPAWVEKIEMHAATALPTSVRTKETVRLSLFVESVSHLVIFFSHNK